MSSELLEEITIQLKHPIEYHVKGETEQATFVNLKPPTSKNVSSCAKIKQLFYIAAQKERKDRIVSEDSNVEKNDSSEDASPSEILALFYMTGTDIDYLFTTFKNIFKNGTMFFDGEQSATKHLLDSLHLDDLENCIGVYISNFTIPSL